MTFFFHSHSRIWLARNDGSPGDACSHVYPYAPTHGIAALQFRRQWQFIMTLGLLLDSCYVLQQILLCFCVNHRADIHCQPIRIAER